MTFRPFCASACALFAGLLQVHAAAIITDFSPAVGTPGDSVVITGSGFLSGNVRIVFWPNRDSGAVPNSDNQITVTVPSGISTGPIAAQVAGSYTNATGPDFLAIGPGPYITDFAPAYGPSNTLVSINGVHFGGTAANGVKFNGTPGTSLSVNAAGNYMSVRVPYGAHTGPISVTTPAGTSNSPSAFTVLGPGPFITSFNPTVGGGGAQVYLLGLQLGNVTSVRFNGVSGTIDTVSATQVAVHAPAGVTTGPITVEAPTGVNAGTNTTSTNFFAPPALSSVSPGSGRAGTNITISGQNLLGATLTLNGTQVTNFTVNNNTTIHAVIPAGAASGSVRVATPAGSAFAPANFLMLPTITGFSPPVGLAGTTVTITGANLNEGLSSVKFNNVAASVVGTPSYGSVTATVPATTTGPVSVTTSNGTFVTATNFFLPPAITSFTPNNTAPGSRVTLTGQNFLGATAVGFNGSPASFNVTNNTTLGATVPGGVITGPISVTAPAGQTVSSARFYGAPLIAGFGPTHGLPGISVLLVGTNFLDASAVWFNGTPATILSGNNGQLLVTVPAGAQTGPLTVAAPGGTNSSAGLFTLDYSSDLSLSLAASPNPVTVGSNLLYTVNIRNDGPFDSPFATISNTLPASVKFVSGSISAPWTLVTSGNPITASVTNFGTGSFATMLLTVTPKSPGSIVDSISISGPYSDPLPANNFTSLATTVEPLPLLSILSLTNSVQISWPASLPHFLEYNTTLATNAYWSNVTTLPAVAGTNKFVIETNLDVSRFYRLHR